MQNSCVAMINNRIIKVEREVEYFRNKAQMPTYYRDKQTYINNTEWKAYWIAIADHKLKIIDELYKLLRIVNKDGIGDISYPLAPSSKELSDE